ncbi:MAG TPA: hypothetical protein PK863_01885 [Candidatus Dojkabacteria bacterium]|jgi:hypothetical protein|nr:hypothetical protein [Candidatus Dojkabacteria bacterium]HRP37276.1 hypothetical protein [Candidatus Dojkabacteria bacterium]HRP50789.1 hypothetical protein [Candidatus Dojkabacteria bacterium]
MGIRDIWQQMTLREAKSRKKSIRSSQIELAKQLLFLIATKQLGIVGKQKRKIFQFQFGKVNHNTYNRRCIHADSLEQWLEDQNIKLKFKNIANG